VLGTGGRGALVRHSAPLQGYIDYRRPITQGVALGFRSAPLWGFRLLVCREVVALERVALTCVGLWHFFLARFEPMCPSQMLNDRIPNHGYNDGRQLIPPPCPATHGRRAESASRSPFPRAY
jgi:hypothetical protein